MTEFEKVSNETMNDDSDDMKENCIYWLNGDKYATVNFTQELFINRIQNLRKKFPDDIKIKSQKKGLLLATVPVSFIKVGKKLVTDEQRKQMSERLRNARNS
jgi:hypothetical protein